MSSDLSPQTDHHHPQHPSVDEFERIASRMDGFLYRCSYDQPYTMLLLLGAVHATTGYSREALLCNHQLAYAQLIHPDDQALVRGSRVKAIMDNSEWNIDYRIHHSDGEWLWVNDRGTAVYDVQGEVACLEGAVLDVSARKHVEQELAKTSHALRERFKEVACLGKVAALTNRDMSIDETLTVAAGLLPSGWQYPTRCEALIYYQDRRYASSRREPNEWRLQTPINLQGSQVGWVIIWYVQPPPGSARAFS